jgi:hypothetical protein
MLDSACEPTRRLCSRQRQQQLVLLLRVRAVPDLDYYLPQRIRKCRKPRAVLRFSPAAPRRSGVSLVR